MAYDGPSQRAYPEGPDGSPYRGEPGFREEPDFRGAGSSYQPADYQPGSYPVAEPASETKPGAGRRVAAGGGVSSIALDDVFDDPDHGEPGRDRMGVHFAWELVLLLGVGAVGFLLWSSHAEVFRGPELRGMLVLVAGLGLITLAAGVSLRVASVNLAVGPVAIAAGIFFAKQGNDGVVPTAGIALLAAAGLGLLVAILVAGFHVPGWAASLAAGFAAIVWIQGHSGPVSVSGGFDPTDHAYYLAGGFAAVAVLGGLIASIKTVRRTIGRFRPVADPARRRGGLAATLAGGAVVLSMVLAAAGGVLLSANTSQIQPTPGLELSGLAIGAALLGGTSAFGRRGGVFGTLLAVVLLVLFMTYDDAEKWRISLYATAGVLVCAGLIVTRVVETLGRPRSARDVVDDDLDDDGWTTTGGTPSTTDPGWSSTRQDSWSSALPGQSSSGRTTDLWADDRWGTRSTP